jgi:hypothetical protein
MQENTIPAHLRAILAGRVKARAVAPLVAVPDRAPVFAPAQGGVSPRRSAADVIEEAGEIESHDAPMLGDNCDPEGFALVQGE